MLDAVTAGFGGASGTLGQGARIGASVPDGAAPVLPARVAASADSVSLSAEAVRLHAALQDNGLGMAIDVAAVKVSASSNAGSAQADALSIGISFSDDPAKEEAGSAVGQVRGLSIHINGANGPQMFLVPDVTPHGPATARDKQAAVAAALAAAAKDAQGGAFSIELSSVVINPDQNSTQDGLVIARDAAGKWTVDESHLTTQESSSGYAQQRQFSEVSVDGAGAALSETEIHDQQVVNYEPGTSVLQSIAFSDVETTRTLGIGTSTTPPMDARTADAAKALKALLAFEQAQRHGTGLQPSEPAGKTVTATFQTGLG